MVQTGADIYSSLIMEEIKNNAGKSISKGFRPAVNKIFRASGDKSAKKAAESGYYNEIRGMVRQQSYRSQK